jgi:FMN-dependent NADH-azoreductase
MASILVLNSSVLGDGSVSKVLVEEAVHRLLEASPGATIIHRDLGTAPVLHLTTANVAGVRVSPRQMPNWPPGPYRTSRSRNCELPTPS